MRILLAVLLLLFTGSSTLALDWMGGDQSNGGWFDATEEMAVGNDRVIIFYSDYCPPCKVLARKLNAADGPLERLQIAGWRIGHDDTNQIQTIYAESTTLDEALDINSFPAIVKLESGRVVRRLDQGCGTVIDQWALGWLHKGIREHPPAREPLKVQTTGNYQVHGQRWNFDGRWSPSHKFMVNHLLRAKQHHGKFTGWGLNGWSKAELWSLHDDDHEGRVKSRTKKPILTTFNRKKSNTYCPT
jgi:hypothetical protein